MRRCLPYIFIATLIAVSGCATQTIQQSTTFAKAGMDYGDAIVEFLDVYIVTRVDTNSRRALVVRSAKIDAQLAGELPKELADFDARALTAVRETGQLRNNVRLLRAYFEALNALVTSTVPDDGGAALKSLGESINSINTATGADAQKFSAGQLASIEKIGKLAVKAAVAAKVREALQRDKEAIAWQLTWEEVTLGALVEPVRQEYARQLDQFHTEKVVQPYVDAAAKPGAAWMTDRRAWVQSRFYVESFDKAQKAAAHMRAVWEDMISGQSDVQSIRLILADLKEFTGIVRAYDEAGKKN